MNIQGLRYGVRPKRYIPATPPGTNHCFQRAKRPGYLVGQFPSGDGNPRWAEWNGKLLRLAVDGAVEPPVDGAPFFTIQITQHQATSKGF